MTKLTRNIKVVDSILTNQIYSDLIRADNFNTPNPIFGAQFKKCILKPYNIPSKKRFNTILQITLM